MREWRFALPDTEAVVEREAVVLGEPAAECVGATEGAASVERRGLTLGEPLAVSDVAGASVALPDSVPLAEDAAAALPERGAEGVWGAERDAAKESEAVLLVVEKNEAVAMLAEGDRLEAALPLHAREKLPELDRKSVV